jgi:exodeoxyribonuclease VII small subunit
MTKRTKVFTSGCVNFVALSSQKSDATPPPDPISVLDGAGDRSYFAEVSNASKSTGQNASAKAGTLPFEEALKKLETIVEAMESEELPLETLLTKYEEGARLAKICQDKLAEAETKIEQLEKNSSGETKLKPFAPQE